MVLCCERILEWEGALVLGGLLNLGMALGEHVEQTLVKIGEHAIHVDEDNGRTLICRCIVRISRSIAWSLARGLHWGAGASQALLADARLLMP